MGVGGEREGFGGEWLVGSGQWAVGSGQAGLLVFIANVRQSRLAWRWESGWLRCGGGGHHGHSLGITKQANVPSIHFPETKMPSL